MVKIKQAFSWLTGRLAYYLLPRNLRMSIIKAMLLAEQPAPPRDSVRWMLGVYDYVATAIDMQAIRFSRVVHGQFHVVWR